MISDLKGVSMAEYAIIAVLVIVGAIVAFTTLGEKITAGVDKVNQGFR